MANDSKQTQLDSEITIQELESAINFWRQHKPSMGEPHMLCLEAAALSKHYALMIVQRVQSMPVRLFDESALRAWRYYLESSQHRNAS